MPFATFGDFRAALCELWGAPAPPCESGADQEIRFTLALHGLDIAFSTHPEADPDLFRLSVPTGVHLLGPDVDAIKAILNTNYLLSMAGSPTLLAQQADGSLALQQSLRLSDVQIHSLVSTLSRIADLLTRPARPPGDLEVSTGSALPCGDLLLRA